MGRDMAVRLLLVSILLSTAWLVLAEAQVTPNEAAAASGDFPTTAAVSSDPSEARRQRLRSFFAKRREQRVKPGDDGQRGNGQRESQTFGSGRLRPRVTGIRNQEPDETEIGEERVETSVSVSSSVSTSSKIRKRTKTKTPPINVKPEETAVDTDSPNRTTRKRFRLIKNSKVNQEALLEKLLANIVKKNEIEPQKQTRRPSRFRPSINRDQIRKKAESALRPKETNSRPRFRKPNTTTEKTIITTTAQDQEVDAVTEPIVPLKQSEDESIVKQVTTVVTESYTEVTQVAEEVFNPVTEAKEITTERQNIPARTTSKSFEITTKINRKNFFRRHRPRKFGFSRRPSVTAIVQEDVIEPKPTVSADVDDRAILSNNLPKEAELKFGSFPARNRLNPITPKDEEVQQFIRSIPEPVEIQPTLLPQQISNDLQPAFKLISDSEPKPQVNSNTRNNQINRFQNSLSSPNSIVQPAFLKPTQLKKPQPINVPETQRSIAQPTLRIRGRPNRIQPEAREQQEVIVQQATVQPITRETVFFELPDFFNLPFATQQTQTPSSPNQRATPAQNNAGALFNSASLPQGTVQGHPRATNLNIITGSYSIGW